jgi:hypothetical protein
VLTVDIDSASSFYCKKDRRLQYLYEFGAFLLGAERLRPTMQISGAQKAVPVHLRRSRRVATRMRELTSSNDWSTPLRGANQPLERQDLLHNQSLRAHYAGKPAGQLAH